MHVMTDSLGRSQIVDGDAPDDASGSDEQRAALEYAQKAAKLESHKLFTEAYMSHRITRPDMRRYLELDWYALVLSQMLGAKIPSREERARERQAYLVSKGVAIL